MHGLVEIAPVPPVPRCDLFTYRVPDALRDRIAPGMRVRIPLGRQTRSGVVTGFASAPPPGELRTLLDLVDDDAPFLPADLLELCRWTARYYLASLADVIGTIVPARIPEPPVERAIRVVQRLDAGAIDTLTRRTPARARAYRAVADTAEGMAATRVLRDAGVGATALRPLLDAGILEAIAIRREAPRDDGPAPPATRPPTLTPGQRTATGILADDIARRTAGSYLLHGVTGSGKTEVFLAAAEATLGADRDVLILVPEIALTHQAVERVRGRFGHTVALLHSGLGPRERWAEWRRIRSRDARVVVGARSAIFAPLARLGLIVVDEEHDAAYKQEEGVRYNARDLAVVRARLAGATCVLASATPSAETFHAATIGRHRLLELPSRATGGALPPVHVIDLRERPRDVDAASGKPSVLSPELRAAMQNTLDHGGQTLVFLNRRGFATYLQCPACGTAAQCPQCSVSLTWHREDRALVCHHCQFRRRPPEQCEDCKGPPLQAFGVGTEQIEAAVREGFPGATVARMDRDAAARPGAQRRILGEWRAGATDVLVGTQMVSKGHDVPGVTLVAVLLADLSLNVPDFRASERTFQLLVQVAGRAGRGTSPGQVLIQTLRPNHASLLAAATHDYPGFMAGELERRRALGYPPFARLVSLRLDGKDEAAVETHANDLADRLRRHAEGAGLPPMSVLGPAPPPVARVRGRFRRQILLRAEDVRALRTLARRAHAAAGRLGRGGIRLVVDVDPYSM